MDMINELDLSNDRKEELFNTIILSINSNSDKITLEKKEKDSLGESGVTACSIRTSKIKLDTQNSNLIKEYSIFISKEKRFLLHDKYKMIVSGTSRSFSAYSEPKIIDINFSNSKKLKEIYCLLDDLKNQSLKKESAIILNQIISDIDQSIDEAYKRDSKLDEILNK